MLAKHDILVVGSGWAGARHCEAFAQTGRANVAVCEPDAARRGATAAGRA